MTDAPRALDRAALDAGPFPIAQCDALFAAVLIDDELDADARLPAEIRFDYAQDELAACFRICRQLWYSGFDRDGLGQLIARLVRDRDLDAADRLRFKHIRAKFKHFRYAHALYGAPHAYPRLLNRVTVTMGHLQDAYRNKRRGTVLREAYILRLLLARLPLARLYREADRLLLTSPSAFRALLEKDVRSLAALVADDMVTGHRFHVTRKVIGRQVSFWDTLRTIEPTQDRYDMSRSLSAINGLMGDLHDQLVERRAVDRASYGRSFVLPAEIKARIKALLEVYPSP
ncbi:hypothetical protein [Sphingomonas abietis]|uniref:CHAD domain-containing protein n=1 Tax=Sphingomonas abietis TaxID=3012344 RepID=A0ABY7NI67_9SPHN|nr:hypothetical protein [Sphingomonas abietis]WBO21033.1 hypothetical protein PBT88_12545 [Sphingomonas abietis]